MGKLNVDGSYFLALSKNKKSGIRKNKKEKKYLVHTGTFIIDLTPCLTKSIARKSKITALFCTHISGKKSLYPFAHTLQAKHHCTLCTHFRQKFPAPFWTLFRQKITAPFALTFQENNDFTLLHSFFRQKFPPPFCTHFSGKISLHPCTDFLGKKSLHPFALTF